jgi:LEA14-like dessication related protein
MILLLSGCSLVQPEPLEPPAVNLRGLELQAMGINSQVFRVRLSLFNPNSVPLKVSGGEVALEIAGVSAAKGRTLDPFTVAAGAEQEVEILVSTHLLRDAPALLGVLTGGSAGEGLEYRLSGHVDVQRRGPDRVSIQSTGRLGFPNGPDRENAAPRPPGAGL